MRNIGLILLALVAIVLGVMLLTTKKSAVEQQRADRETISSISNRWLQTSSSLEDQRQTNAGLEQDLQKTRQEYEKAVNELSNTIKQVSNNLSLTESNLNLTEASLRATREEMARRDSRITELEGQNQELDKKALDLSNAITNLTTQIAETERKLAASEGDKAFLQTELKRLMTEKVELEKQFNDLTVLRAQVAKLKEELSIARRIELIRRGLFSDPDAKGAQKLMQVGGAPQTKPRASYDLNVEVSADGTVKVIPPPTNAPASTNQTKP